MLLCKNALCYWMDKEEVNIRHYNMVLCGNALYYWMDKEEVNLRYYNMLLSKNELCYWMDKEEVNLRYFTSKVNRYNQTNLEGKSINTLKDKEHVNGYVKFVKCPYSSAKGYERFRKIPKSSYRYALKGTAVCTFI